MNEFQDYDKIPSFTGDPSQAEEIGGGNMLPPGIYNDMELMVTKVEFGLSSQKQTPFCKMTFAIFGHKQHSGRTVIKRYYLTKDARRFFYTMHSSLGHKNFDPKQFRSKSVGKAVKCNVEGYIEEYETKEGEQKSITKYNIWEVKPSESNVNSGSEAYEDDDIPF